MLSGRGYGALIGNDETSVFRMRSDDPGTWSLEAESPRLKVRFFAGPTPAAALRRFTRATGRQPAAPAPYAFGPWFQTGQKNKIPLAEEAADVKKLRSADAPVSLAETQMHFLPCGAQRGNEAYNRQRTSFFHSQGLAHLIYFNPLICTPYQPVYTQAAQAGVLQRAPGGQPFVYNGFVGGSEPAGFTVEPLSQFDFSAPKASAFYGRLLREAYDGGHDGWMEDFGEYTPPQAISADGTPGPAMHNRYPTTYHCAAYDIARHLPRALIRFQRSGWTGSARCAYDVWGGDPTTVFGFDGLSSAVKEALSMGMSGVSRWGSDIGGYDSFGPAEKLSPELLERWIEFGAVSGVMRTKGSGLAVPSYRRPQIYDNDVLPVWRRYAKLHTQLYPYLDAADAAYRATGVPIMRQLALAYPADARAAARDDEFLFGPDLLAAPVVEGGAVRRSLYLPQGRWIDLWRSAAYVARTGAIGLRRARVLRGARSVGLPAPLGELPLLVRAGAVLPLLSADVDTLAGYGHGRGLVHLGDRRDRLSLLAFPRGSSVGRFYGGERVLSREAPLGRPPSWQLSVLGKRVRTYRVQASLAVLARRFVPRRLVVNGRAVPRRRWHYDRRTRVLKFAARGRVVRVSVR
jgi:alpha-glucosidase (family GH31 glycosyl hydrolase)